MCELIGISRQQYYRTLWRKACSRNRATDVVCLVEQMRMEMPRIGGRKLYYLLFDKLQTMGVGRDRFFDVLRANHLLIKPKRSYHITTNSHHRFRKYKNLIAGMELTHPEQVFVSDITYIGSRNDHLYLALVTDAYSKKIMGYDLSRSLDTSGALKALKMAYGNKLYGQVKTIHHSDRGIQYCSDKYQAQMRKYGITPSMTESYDPYANAVAERVDGILKQEFLLEELNLDFRGMCQAVRGAIATYNTSRPHYSCGYLTPEQMHAQHEVKIRTYRKITESKFQLTLCS